MDIDIAVDELYASGWSSLDTAGCEPLPNGRWAPSVERVRREMQAAGFDLNIRHVQLFDCYRAEWSETQTGAAAGAVVGQSEREAAVYAFAQCRRTMADATA